MASHTSFLMVVNPRSGRNRRHQTAQQVHHQLKQRGCNVFVVETQAKGDAQRVVSQRCSDVDQCPSCVVACGGDGTVQEVAHTLAVLAAQNDIKPPVLGLAPAGRCNDFAKFLGVSTKASRIVDILLSGKPMDVDLGLANGRHFCTVATAGIDADISSFVDHMKMPLRGTAAYLYGALRVLMIYKPFKLRLEGDFGVAEREVFLASTANTSTYGGAIPIVPHADVTDGLIDMCVIDYQSKLRVSMLVPAIIAGKHTRRKGVTFYKSKRFQLDADRPIEIWADGEPIATTPVTLEVVPKAITVMVPR